MKNENVLRYLKKKNKTQSYNNKHVDVIPAYFPHWIPAIFTDENILKSNKVFMNRNPYCFVTAWLNGVATHK